MCVSSQKVTDQPKYQSQDYLNPKLTSNIFVLDGKGSGGY